MLELLVRERFLWLFVQRELCWPLQIDESNGAVLAMADRRIEWRCAPWTSRWFPGRVYEAVLAFYDEAKLSALQRTLCGLCIPARHLSAAISWSVAGPAQGTIRTSTQTRGLCACGPELVTHTILEIHLVPPDMNRGKCGSHLFCKARVPLDKGSRSNQLPKI